MKQDNQSLIIGAIIGFVAGWVAEWAGYRLLWRQRDPQLRGLLADAEAEKQRWERFVSQNREKLDRLATLEGNLAAQEAELVGSKGAITQLRAELDSARQTITVLEAELQAAGAAPAQPDRLEKIKGIGKVFATRLNEAGIYTFAQLAALTPEQLEQTLEAESFQAANFEDWITQAKVLAEQSED